MNLFYTNTLLHRLSAFVLRTYAQARRYIFVDENDIKQTTKEQWMFQRTWNGSSQRDEGNVISSIVKPMSFSQNSIISDYIFAIIVLMF